MIFKNNTFTPTTFEKTKFFKEIEADLKKVNLSVGEIKAGRANVRVRNKVTKLVELQIGSVEVSMYIAKDGDIVAIQREIADSCPFWNRQHIIPFNFPIIGIVENLIYVSFGYLILNFDCHMMIADR